MVVGALPPNNHRGQAMLPSISLTPDERNTLLDYYRAPCDDPALRLRAHIILLLADGHTWATIAAVLFCSSRTIDRWHKRFAQGRVEALGGHTRGRPPRLAQRFADLVVYWVTQLTPRTFGYLRSRWSCALLAVALRHRCHLAVSRETVRRWLGGADIVWRRPRPILDRTDPDRETILGKLRALLRDLPDDETAVFEDEVDINLNPDIGFMWMRRGQQAEVVTPGDNEKKYLAGSLHWRTGALLAPVTGPKRNGPLVAAHLEELCRRLRRYKVIHVIWDSPRIHLCGAVVKAHGGRLVLHQLPKYAPECNPVERVWWHLREEITRNHTCRTIAELVDLVFRWLEGRERFVVEDQVYHEEAPAERQALAA
jgi:transposase